MTIATQPTSTSTSLRTTRRLLAIAAISTAGCSTLPVVPPDMARVDPQGGQFQVASGRIVSPERSRELIAQLTAKDPNPTALARHLALEQSVSDTPLVLGNRVVILENGPTTYA